MMQIRSLFITSASLALTSSVLFNAYWQKKQFYPSVVYLTKSNASLAVLYLQAFVFVLLTGKLCRKIFFGPLRTIEMEHLIERSWYAVSETCLAFTVFRDDLSPRFVSLFTMLLFLKCFHWLAEDRVDVMERSPNIRFLFHARLISLLTLLSMADSLGVKLAYDSTIISGPSVQLVFGFEYAILFVCVCNVTIKYIVHVIDYIRANSTGANGANNYRNWEEKAVYLLYSELAVSASKVILYMTFITLMMKIHTFPLFAIRPMYLSMRSLKKAINDVIQSRRAIFNMNSLYPNATVQELNETDNVCIICREEMVGVSVGPTGQLVTPSSGLAKRLPCGHIFHVSCLRSWFQRQQTCPTCRLDVLRASVTRMAANAAGNPIGRANVPQPANQALNQEQLQGLMQQVFLAQLLGQNNVNQLNLNNGTPSNQPTPGSTPSNPSTSGPVPSTSSAGPSTSSSSIPVATTSSNSNGNNGVGGSPFQGPSSSNQQIDTSNLSDSELAVLVRRERQGLEARLRLYVETRSLVDTAIRNLNLFNSALSLSIASGTEVSGSSRATTIDEESNTFVSIPAEMMPEEEDDGDDGQDGRILSEEERFRRRTHSDVRRVRVQKFSSIPEQTTSEQPAHVSSEPDTLSPENPPPTLSPSQPHDQDDAAPQ